MTSATSSELAGAWGGDPARKQTSIATARAALAAGPEVCCSAVISPVNVYCAAYGTVDPAELEARAGVPAGTLLLAAAALGSCQYYGPVSGDDVPAYRMAAGTEGAPIAVLEAIRVGADPLALARCYVVDLLVRLATLVGPAGQVLTPDQQALVRRLAALHESDGTDPAAFRAFRRAATSTTDAATGYLATGILKFVESVGWPLAGLTMELPIFVARLHGVLCDRLAPERPSAEEQATLDALDAVYAATNERLAADPTLDVETEQAKDRATPEYAAAHEPALHERLRHYGRLAAEAYAPFAVDLLIGAFRRA